MSRENEFFYKTVHVILAYTHRKISHYSSISPDEWGDYITEREPIRNSYFYMTDIRGGDGNHITYLLFPDSISFTGTVYEQH